MADVNRRNFMKIVGGGVALLGMGGITFVNGAQAESGGGEGANGE